MRASKIQEKFSHAWSLKLRIIFKRTVFERLKYLTLNPAWSNTAAAAVESIAAAAAAGVAGGAAATAAAGGAAPTAVG
eukprot:COSAG01_NODE_13867_length_1525_cov_1.835203_2_plen_77_part_01